MIDVLIEFVPVILLLVIGGIAMLWFNLSSNREARRRSRCDINSDFMNFEAYPVHLEDLKADMLSNGWSLKSENPAEEGRVLFRFEKDGNGSASLREVFDFEKSMPRTANRTAGSDLIIKIGDYGVKRDINTQPVNISNNVIGGLSQ
ncbi:hypothetical protein [Parasphingorhabdus sp. NYA22]